MKKELVILVIIMLILLFLLAQCDVFKTHTGSLVTLIEVKENSMVVENLDHEMITIKIPKIIKPLLSEGEEYFVEYVHSKWHKPKLVEIQK